MYNTQNTIILFDSSFDNNYVSTWMKAIKTQKIKHLYIYVLKNNTFRFIVGGENDKANIANADLLLHLYFDYREFADIPVDLNKLVQFLSSEEKSEYIKHQTILIEDETWLFYDVRKMMIKWIRDTYPTKFDEYVTSVIKDRLISYKSCPIYVDTIARLEKIAEDNYLSEQSKNSKTRDISKELEIELKELCDKINKLNVFIKGSEIYETLPNVERTAMKRQLAAMEKYADELRIRIKSINDRSTKDAK